ncbi:MAG: hypothetical protein JSS68_18885 [Actinobacteria bacterium]|nr:hypothetical protein [Actinomycetota bacterium]
MRRPLDMKTPAAKAAAGMALVLMLAAAASYAAVGRGGSHERRGTGAPLTVRSSPIAASGTAAIRIVGHPPELSTDSTARFRVVATGEPPLRCRLDGEAPQACGAAIVYRGMNPGPHTFYVGAQRPGAASLKASFEWDVLEPKPFTISPRPAAVGPLYPGAVPSPIPVVVTNPNSVAITVTSLRVSADGGPPGCDPDANLTLTTPALAGGKLRIGAHASVSLPSATVAAPTIALLELPVDQDACQEASFELTFSGSAGA